MSENHGWFITSSGPLLPNLLMCYLVCWTAFFESIGSQNLSPHSTNPMACLSSLFELAVPTPYPEFTLVFAQNRAWIQKCIHTQLSPMHSNPQRLHDCICTKLLEPCSQEFLKYRMNFMASIFSPLPSQSTLSNPFYQIQCFQALRLDELSHCYARSWAIVQCMQQRILTQKMVYLFVFS
jgi:hypothetical protein